jgi:hypothetical protein
MSTKETNKRPKNIKYYELKEEVVAEEIVDSYQMISMIFGVIAFIFKYRFSIWVSLVFFLANYNQQKIGVPHGKFYMNFGLLVLSFLLIYIFPS